jgi:pyruvate kinase
MRKTKIVATIGPAVDTDDLMRALFLEGVDVCRLNFSHGTHEEHKVRIDRIRRISKELSLPIPILVDTKGPEVRVGRFAGGSIMLKLGDTFTLTPDDIVGNQQRAPISYPYLAEDIKIGSPILIDDGLIELEVTAIEGKDVVTVVRCGGEVSDRKGINLPNTPTRLPALSDADIRDLKFGVDQDIDFVAASFVRSKDDVEAIRDVIREAGGDGIRIIAKIENREGIANFDEIMRSADGIMVARGDLGVEIPLEEVPTVQKRLIDQCVKMGKPVITATQMLDSMIRNPRPTRAEVSDVANAIHDGTSAVMLSGETASGKYPVESVRTMARAAVATESSIDYWEAFRRDIFYLEDNTPNAISHAACMTAMDLGARAIAVMTYSGNSARLMSRFRPECPIIATTVSERSVRQLNLSWGVIPRLVDVVDDTDAVFQQGIETTMEILDVSRGDTVILAGGTPVGCSGTTNTIKVHLVGEETACDMPDV